MTAEDRPAFDLASFFPPAAVDEITEIRVAQPEAVVDEALARRGRGPLAPHGRIAILAADHPARGVTAVGGAPLRMGDRWEYLGRVLRVITAPEWDGVMTTPDFMEEILIVHRLVRERGGPAFLDGKIIIGCMQRGGIAGVAGEIDDRFGSYSPDSLEAMRFEGGKMMFRVVPDDERSLLTIDYCANAVTELARRGLYSFLEPLPMRQADGRYVSDYTVPNLVKLVSVAAGLGESSRYTWLKIPYVEGFDTVARATTLPILMLGGESREDPAPILREFAAGMRAGGNVRGVLVGRNVTFPGREDPLAVALAVRGVVYDGLTDEQAMRRLAEIRGRDMDMLSRYL